MPISWANERLADRYLWFSGIVFTGLALAGKGFAYVIPAPFFISEVTMLVGFLVLLRAGNVRALFTMPQTFILLALAGWGIYRTLPYIPKYQIDAVRDAFLFGYMGWAFVIAGLVIAKPERLNTVIRWFATFTRFFLVAGPLAWLVAKFAGSSLPLWPWAPTVPIMYLKGGDTCVILAGIMAFWVAGFMTQISLYYITSLLTLMLICGSFVRAGLMAFMSSMFLCMFCKPRSPWPWRVIGTLMFGAATLYVTNIEIMIPGRPRAISFDQFIENFTSVLGQSSRPDLEATKEWRKQWWEEILHYSLHGPYKWSGKGFGINLATDDGFQVGKEDELRSPHNGHLNMLGRSGIPGGGLWALAHLSWGFGMAVCFFVSRKRGHGQWPNVFLWLSAFFIANHVNASFDVYFEGPMGGVPLWTTYGMGLAAMYLYKHCPEILRHPDEPVPLADYEPLFEPMFSPQPPAPPRGFTPTPAGAFKSGDPAQLAGFHRMSRN